MSREIAQPDHGCGVALMSAYKHGAGFYGNLNFVSPGRDALVFADTLGCTYSHIDVSIASSGGTESDSH